MGHIFLKFYLDKITLLREIFMCMTQFQYENKTQVAIIFGAGTGLSFSLVKKLCVRFCRIGGGS